MATTSVVVRLKDARNALQVAAAAQSKAKQRDSRVLVSGITTLESAGARAAVGIAGGVLVAAFATRGLQTLLFEVQLADAITYGTVVTLVALVVGLASYVPARRAAKTNPLTLLRRE